MLLGALGIRLILLIGKTVPLPAPKSVMTALKRVEITNATDGNDGFDMTFTLGKGKLGDYELLSSGALDPDTRVVIGVLLGASPEPLIDGVIYHHQVVPSNQPGMSTLTVKGRDISVLLDLKERNEKYENRTDSVIATSLILRPEYAQYEIIPQVTQTSDVPLVVDRIPRQNETDLAHLRRLALRNGFVFYIEPLTIGTSIAYWGPENRLGMPQPALTVDMGSSQNVTTFTPSLDALAPVGTEGSFIEPITKMSISIPPLPPLRIPPLVQKETYPRRTKLMRNTSGKNPLQAASAALAEAASAPDSVTATGEIDTVRYGNILRARRLVGVRGAGNSYNGFYKVQSVTHEIEPGASYKQQFKLTREGTGALLPLVLP
jgi:hypothetical protein